MIDKTLKKLKDFLSESEVVGLKKFLKYLGSNETALTISRLSTQEQNKLLTTLDPPDAANVIKKVSDKQAVNLIADLPIENAAAIVDEIPSDKKAAILRQMGKKDAEVILEEMKPDVAEDVRKLLKYDQDTAGGLMISEYVAYEEQNLVSQVLHDLQNNRDKYKNYNVLYLYVTDSSGKLTGVLRMHDLLFKPDNMILKEFMITKPHCIKNTASLGKLREFFSEHKLFGVPVVDSEKRLIGVVRPKAVEEAYHKQADRQFLGFSGIIGGDEFRTMPLVSRSRRRLSWLSINIFLNVLAASVIAYYQDTLSAVIVLAVFLPMISDMSGCSGNQAVAVSMRELTLGLIRPKEIFRVISKEAWLGVINGLALGILLGLITFIWKGNPYLGIVVGCALMVNTVISVVMGGCLPLILKSVKLDPALVSSPILTTITDMCGFFLVLSFATVLLSKLS
ncbi:magnesium transporter [Thermodesulfobacteriota bacterium]